MTKLLRTIGGLEIWGGVAGVALVLDHTSFPMDPLRAGFTVFAGVFYAMGLLGGILLLRGNRWGMALSIITNALQVVSVTTGTVVYHLHSGAIIGVGLENGMVTGEAALTSGFQLAVLSHAGDGGIAINILAITVLGILVQADYSSLLGPQTNPE